MPVRSSNTLNKLWGFIVNEVFKSTSKNPNKAINRSVHFGINQGFEEVSLDDRIESEKDYPLPNNMSITSLSLTEIFRAVIQVGDAGTAHGLLPSEGVGNLLSYSRSLSPMQDIFPDLDSSDAPYNIYVNDDDELVLTFRRDLIPTDLAQAENLIVEVRDPMGSSIDYRHARQLSGSLPHDYQAGSIRVSKMKSWGGLRHEAVDCYPLSVRGD